MRFDAVGAPRSRPKPGEVSWIGSTNERSSEHTGGIRYGCSLSDLTRFTGLRLPELQFRFLPRYRRAANTWRRGRDSNPRYLSVYTLSKRAPSAARTPLRTYRMQCSRPHVARVRTERVGFEPTVPCKGYTGFRNQPDRPLWHLSAVFYDSLVRRRISKSTFQDAACLRSTAAPPVFVEPPLRISPSVRLGGSP